MKMNGQEVQLLHGDVTIQLIFCTAKLSTNRNATR